MELHVFAQLVTAQHAAAMELAYHVFLDLF